MARAIWWSFLTVSFVALFGSRALAQAEAPEKAEAPATAETPDTAPKSKPPKAEADEPAAAPLGRFLRVLRDAQDQPTSLDTAVVRYVPADGKGELTVDLVAAVHVGEKQYYRALNKLFDQYEVVLFELVMAEGTKLPDGTKRDTGMMSNMVKSMLALESQVERIDYTKKHFVHADMTPKQMADAMKKRGDTGLTLTLSVFTEMMREANRQEARLKANPKRKPPQVDLATLLFSNDAPMRLKRVMADQMETSGDAGSFGPTLTAMLITDRNEAAMKVLDREIKAGRRKIAIYYGAAHLPDFDLRLAKDFALKSDTTTWIQAWDLED